MRVFWWTVAAVAALILIAFSIANRGGVAVSFAPLPFTLDVPLFAVALGALALGLIAGVFAKTLAGSPHRRIARDRLHRIRALEREVADLRAERDRLRGTATAGGTSVVAGSTRSAA
ncbi:MAG: LapA family protein [Alphaproteobacteria bacterium]